MMRLLSTYSEPEHQIYSLCPCQDYETSSKPPAEALLFALLRATLKVAVTRRAVGSPTAVCPHSVLHQESFRVFNLTSRYYLHAFSCLCVRDDCIFSVITQFSINLLFLNPCTVINQVCTWQWLTNQYKLLWHCWTWRRHFLFSMGCKQHLIIYLFIYLFDLY